LQNVIFERISLYNTSELNTDRKITFHLIRNQCLMIFFCVCRFLFYQVTNHGRVTMRCDYADALRPYHVPFA